MRSYDSNACDANSGIRFVPNLCVMQCVRVESKVVATILYNPLRPKSRSGF